MAKKIRAQVLGGAEKTLADDSVKTVGDVKRQMGVSENYEATVNGEPADNDYQLSDFEYVSLAPAVKGGN